LRTENFWSLGFLPTGIKFYNFVIRSGKVQEWLNWQHWKCCVPQKGTVGSNPTLSAIFLSEFSANQQNIPRFLLKTSEITVVWQQVVYKIQS
jgi:hypothetical protein